MSDNRTYPVQLLQPDGRRVLDREYTPLIADIGPDPTVCAPSTKTWWLCGESTSKPPHCSDKGSWVCGRRYWDRKPHRSVRPAR